MESQEGAVSSCEEIPSPVQAETAPGLERYASAKPASYLLLLSWPASLPGGVNQVVLNLARELQERGCNPVLGVTSWDSNPQPPFERGIEVVNLRLRAPLTSSGSLRLLPSFLVSFLSVARDWRTFLWERNVDVVNVHYPDLSALVFVLLQMLGIFRGKLVLSFHGSDVTEVAKSRGIGRTGWKFLMSKADAVVACSNALCREILNFAPKASVTAVHNGVDLAVFAGEAVTKCSTPTILNVGKFDLNKGQDLLLSAFLLVRQAIPNASLILVGAAGPALELVKRFVRENGLQDAVEMHVDVPHHRIPSFMKRADLFVLPSRSEAFGLVLLEAGASGLPVIASRVGGIPELIEDGKTGVLIDPENSGQLAFAMRDLLLDRDRAKRLAAEWQQQATTMWGWDQTCRSYLAITRPG